MKVFEAKTINDAIQVASKELNISIADIRYIIKEKGDEKVIIEVYTLNDVGNFGVEYLKKVIKSFNINVKNISMHVDANKIIYITVDSDNNSILIGKNGKTLKAFSNLLRLIISNYFKIKYSVFLDIGDYINKKYLKIIDLTKNVAKEASKRHIDIKLDVMNSDERRVVHQTLVENFTDVIGESVGENTSRAIVIKYVGKEEHSFQQNPIYYKDIIGNKIEQKKDFDINSKNNNIDKSVEQQNITANDDDLPSASISSSTIIHHFNDFDKKNED